MKNRESIHWRPWHAGAFQQARQEGKPIFLSISATWCHWCHVLDEESFTHPEVIRRINADFIPIQVDSDKRPDINGRYNMGGWPTVAILNAEGEVRVGGTYMPTSQLLSMLVQGKEDLSSGQQALPKKKLAVMPEIVRLEESMIQTVADSMERAYDPSFGGFGGPLKFPQPWAIELAFHLHARTGDQKWLQMATFTLDNMREGGLYDTIDGGFFRYSASSDWDNPHYEKLLEVNAQLISLYLKAYQLTGQITYRATAQGVLDYLQSSLIHETQVWFYGSQSADREYYTQSDEERGMLDSPACDGTLYTDRNAMAVSALLMTYPILENPVYREKAFALIEYLWKHCQKTKRGMFHCDDGKLTLYGYLSDQTHMMMALLDAYESSGNRSYLQQAEELESVMDQQLWDGEQAGYWDLPVGSETNGLLKVRVKPFVENCITAILLLRLYHLSGRDHYRQRSESVLGYLSTVFKVFKYQAAPFALALERFLYPPHHVTIVGKKEDIRWGDLLRAARLLKSPWKVVCPLDSKTDTERIASLGYPVSDEPLAYLCVGKACLPPVARAEDLATAADRLI